jgi:regulatory protein
MKEIPGNDEEVIFRKAADYCAASEHCISEVRQKLVYWKAESSSIEDILSKLIKQGFIDEKRYAGSFARGKFRNLKWGRIKIRFELKKKQINTALISAAIREINEKEYLECINDLITKKFKSLGGTTPENKVKVMRFLASKGFEPEIVNERILED